MKYRNKELKNIINYYIYMKLQLLFLLQLFLAFYFYILLIFN
jgi:hypothetical protein